MVQASTFVLAAAALAVAPALAAPSPAGHHQTHHTKAHGAAAPTEAAVAPASVSAPSTTSPELTSREPEPHPEPIPFNWRGALRGVAHVAGKVGSVALKAAPLLLRDVDGNVYEIDARDLDELDELDAREPKFRLGRALRSVARVAGKVGGVALKAAPLLLRDVDGTVYEIDARDFDELDELDAREPKFRLGRALRGVARVAGKVGGIAMKAAPLLLRDEDGSIYDARDFDHLEEELDAREFDDVDELDAREPKFRLGRALRGVARVAGKVGGIAMKAAPLLLRDVDSDLSDISERDFLDSADGDFLYVRDEDGAVYVLDARSPRFNLGRTLRKVSGVAHKAVGVANKVMSVAGQFGYRDLSEDAEDMNEAREYEGLEELD